MRQGAPISPDKQASLSHTNSLELCNSLPSFAHGAMVGHFIRLQRMSPRRDGARMCKAFLAVRERVPDVGQPPRDAQFALYAIGPAYWVIHSSHKNDTIIVPEMKFIFFTTIEDARLCNGWASHRLFNATASKTRRYQKGSATEMKHCTEIMESIHQSDQDGDVW